MTDQSNASFAHEVGDDLPNDHLPAYQPMLAALHRACAAELRQMIADLPIRSGERVLDMACGDGVYSAWLAERVGEHGQVIGVDVAPAYLKLAADHAQRNGVADWIIFQQGDIERLPLPDDHVDLAWCAHSLYSLPDPVAALRELRRVTRRGGTIAILENDTLHQMLLPWPVEIELAVRRAQLDALKQDADDPQKFYIGRNLCRSFARAGIDQCGVQTYTIDRRAPLTDDDRTYLIAYLNDLRDRSAPFLDHATLQQLNDLIDPQSSQFLLDQPDFFMSHLEIVARGTA